MASRQNDALSAELRASRAERRESEGRAAEEIRCLRKELEALRLQSDERDSKLLLKLQEGQPLVRAAQISRPKLGDPTENIRAMEEQVSKDFKLDRSSTLEGKCFTPDFHPVGENLPILYGDHGPYCELQTLPSAASRVAEGRWFDHYTLGKTKLYAQKATVADRPNPPPGRFASQLNRIGGYADYKPGKTYIAINEIRVIKNNTPYRLNSDELEAKLRKTKGYVGLSRPRRRSRKKSSRN